MQHAYINVIRRGKQTIVACCDAEILGKTLRQSDLTFEIQKSFYGGRKVEIEEAVGLIDEGTIINLVGNNVVGRAIAEGLVHPEAAIEICGVLHAQIVRL